MVTQNPPEEPGDDASQTAARQNWKKIFAVKRFLRLIWNGFDELKKQQKISQFGSVDPEKRARWAGCLRSVFL